MCKTCHLEISPRERPCINVTSYYAHNKLRKSFHDGLKFQFNLHSTECIYKIYIHIYIDTLSMKK